MFNINNNYMYTDKIFIVMGLRDWFNSALHPSGVAESSTSFGWGKGGWQVTLCDTIWHVIFHSGEVISTNY